MTSDPVPEKADVVVIGAGIIGSATAYYLAKRGADVVVLEKGSLSNEQSGRNWGWICEQGRNPQEIPLVKFPVETWRQLLHELETDIEFIQEGSLKLVYSEEDMAKFEKWTHIANVLGLDTVMLSAMKVKEKFTFLDSPYIGGAFTPDDAQTESRKATLTRPLSSLHWVIEYNSRAMKETA